MLETDCIYISHAIIQTFLENKIPLLRAFIDYEKAFDTVRDALWCKLNDTGISRKPLEMLKNMYKKFLHVLSNIQIHQISLMSFLA